MLKSFGSLFGPTLGKAVADIAARHLDRQHASKAAKDRWSHQKAGRAKADKKAEKERLSHRPDLSTFFIPDWLRMGMEVRRARPYQEGELDELRRFAAALKRGEETDWRERDEDWRC